MTTKETLHLKKPKIVRSTAKEDFAPFIAKEETTPEIPAIDPANEEGIPVTRRDLDEITLLDMFAMQASAGVAKRLEDPGQVAFESFRIAHEMVKVSLRYRQKK